MIGEGEVCMVAFSERMVEGLMVSSLERADMFRWEPLFSLQMGTIWTIL